MLMLVDGRSEALLLLCCHQLQRGFSFCGSAEFDADYHRCQHLRVRVPSLFYTTDVYRLNFSFLN